MLNQKKNFFHIHKIHTQTNLYFTFFAYYHKFYYFYCILLFYLFIFFSMSLFFFNLSFFFVCFFFFFFLLCHLNTLLHLTHTYTQENKVAECDFCLKLTLDFIFINHFTFVTNLNKKRN